MFFFNSLLNKFIILGVFVCFVLFLIYVWILYYISCMLLFMVACMKMMVEKVAMGCEGETEVGIQGKV